MVIIAKIRFFVKKKPCIPIPQQYDKFLFIGLSKFCAHHQKSVILSEAPLARSRRIYAFPLVLSSFSVRRSFDSPLARSG